MKYKKFVLSLFIFIFICLSPSSVNSVSSEEKAKDTFSRYQEPSHFSSDPQSKSITPQLLITPESLTSRTDVDTMVTKKVLVLEFNPILKSTGQRLSVSRGWYDPNTLLTQYISDLYNNSGNTINYVISEHAVVDSYNQKADGFIYDDTTYLACVNSGGTKCHSPDVADYLKILADFQVCEKSNSGQIDELWLFGGPWFGYWEANMAGPNSFYTNGPAIKVGTSCTKNINIMGFNYERSVPEMTEDFIHRTEGTMTHLNTTWKTSLDQPPYTFWDKFTFFSAYPTAPEFPYYGAGNMHFPCNSNDINNPYNWSSSNTVISNADDWFNFPNLLGVSAPVNCNAWGCTGSGYEAWWMNRVPRYVGTSIDGYLNNWWRYVVDYDISNPPTCNQQPQVSAVSPTDNYQYPSTTRSVTLTGHAIFNTCNGTRHREIWVRDVTLNQSLSKLCYYSLDTADTDFSCILSVVANHQYQWIAQANNESNSVSTAVQNFTIGALVTPTPTPIPDTISPVVTITFPSNGSLVTRNSSVLIKSTATDNVSVNRVEFYVNNSKKCTQTTLPYDCSWSVPGNKGSRYTIVAKVFDTAGNNSSSTVTVNSK